MARRKSSGLRLSHVPNPSPACAERENPHFWRNWPTVWAEDRFYFLNFEDNRFLGFQADDATFLYQHLVELYGERRIFLADEIQNIPGWERFVRRFMDLGLELYITGSNAALLNWASG